MQAIITSRRLSLVIAIVAALSGCGDDDKKSTSSSLSGTAATGAPIVGVVVAKDASGEETAPVTIGANGRFTINVKGLTAPFLINAVSDDGKQYFSYSPEANVTVNVTPLTTMALALASNKEPNSLYAVWDTSADSVNESDVKEAAQTVYAHLATEMQAEGVDDANFDFFSLPFSADGTGVDAVMDDISDINISVVGGIVSVKTTDADGNEIPVDDTPDLGGFDFDDDGKITSEDNCPGVANPNQTNSDDDDLGNDCDADDDADGVDDDSDKCLTVDNSLSEDLDLDGCDDADEDTSVDVDTVAPVLAQAVPVPATGTDTTPSYTFSSSEPGTIIYAGDCSAEDTSAVAGKNLVTFNALSAGTHDNCTIVVQDNAGNESEPLEVNEFTITEAAGTCGAGDSTLPAVVKGKTFATTYAGAEIPQHGDGDAASFTFCQNGTLLVNNRQVATTFTTSSPSDTVTLLNWLYPTGDMQYEVVIFNGAFYEVNLSNPKLTSFFGQFTPKTSGGGGDLWTLVISGKSCVSGACSNLPPITVGDLPAPGTAESVQTEVAAEQPGTTITVTSITNTDTKKAFSVKYNIVQSGITILSDLVYTYTKQ